MTLETFDASRYPAEGNPLTEGRRWVDATLDAPVGDYHRGPAVVLYLYSPGKGRGKTHLAAALAGLVHAAGRLVYFADEIGYIERYWAAALEDKAALSQLAGERAFLTVIDDMGQRERTTESLRDAWYAVFNPRWLKRGWTIVTSNYTPSELRQRGTINDATLSRLTQMCGGRMLVFQSGDYRQETIR